jgi:transposase
MSAPHARTRERALALYDIAQESCATQVAERTGRHPQTVMGWLHAYNAQGPDALTYRRTGGRPPFALGSRPASARSCVPPSAQRRPGLEKAPTRRRA